MSWTRFMDMHSGGGAKEKWLYIYIEAPLEEAKVIFYNRFGHNPERVTCTCCGEDYSISSGESLEQLTGWDRGCEYTVDRYIEEQSARYSFNKYKTLDEYKATPNILFIPASDIKPEERVGSVPEQGYVWVD
jgi:hypothetical protein